MSAEQQPSLSSMFRTIHPVGQGGFCTEVHNDGAAVFVYDCGSTSTGKRNKNIVRQALPNKHITGLFISHLHEDHVSLIPELIAADVSIERLILPLMDKSARAQIAALFRSRELVYAILGAGGVTGSNEAVLSVDPLIEGQGITQSDSILPGGWFPAGPTIRSGTVLGEARNKWEYLPFNIQSTKRQKLFKDLCLKEGVDIQRLSEVGYVMHNKTKLKKVYSNVEGGINQNSLIVYSGGTSANRLHERTCSIFPVSRSSEIHPLANGCLYSGDYDCCQLHELSRVLSTANRSDRIGLGQIPHHGSGASWKDGMTSLNRGNWFVQFGENNQYGHPSSRVTSSIIKSRLPMDRWPLLPGWPFIHKVTEQGSTELNQLVTYC